MLRKWRFLIVGLAAIVILAWAADFLDPLVSHSLEKRKVLADLSIPNWRRFTNNACGYVVEFPSRPFENPYTLSNQQNVVSYRQFASTLANDQVFMVATLVSSMTNDFSPAQIELLLAKTAQGTTNDGGQMLSERNITLGAIPGREVELIMPNGNFARMRFYRVGPNLQEVIATAPAANRRSTNISYFMDSFSPASK